MRVIHITYGLDSKPYESHTIIKSILVLESNGEIMSIYKFITDENKKKWYYLKNYKEEFGIRSIRKAIELAIPINSIKVINNEKMIDTYGVFVYLDTQKGKKRKVWCLETLLSLNENNKEFGEIKPDIFDDDYVDREDYDDGSYDDDSDKSEKYKINYGDSTDSDK